ncbi:uncharacterized protein BKA55DRAFT_592508 [Fusarium redolens]|uniref:Uncharacterized protein n=1 Tax=Fusarium redolens TaxID=48865 RepID=A0A9P9HDW5_FUSRE|nr:uncharacterized protein BKA55DRAFT_592508 [Fusarium redolens]KAH7255113.1 hypothetical protein BKA55DRAFT_592508 [Fusarium redolens]
MTFGNFAQTPPGIASASASGLHVGSMLDVVPNQILGNGLITEPTTPKFEQNTAFMHDCTQSQTNGSLEIDGASPITRLSNLMADIYRTLAILTGSSHATKYPSFNFCEYPIGFNGSTNKNVGHELLLLPAPSVLTTLPAFTSKLLSHNAAGVKTLQLGELPLTDEVCSRIGTAVKLMLDALRSAEDMLGLSDYASTTRRCRKADPCGCPFSAGPTERGQDVTPLAYEELSEAFKDNAMMGYEGAHMDNLASKVESVKTMLKNRIDLRI